MQKKQINLEKLNDLIISSLGKEDCYHMTFDHSGENKQLQFAIFEKNEKERIKNGEKINPKIGLDIFITKKSAFVKFRGENIVEENRSLFNFNYWKVKSALFKIWKTVRTYRENEAIDTLREKLPSDQWL